MAKGSNVNLCREELLKDYYEKVYDKYLFDSSIQSRGIDYFEKLLEKNWTSDSNLINVLEVGAGKGEHLRYVKNLPTNSYVALDLRKVEVDVKSLGLHLDFQRVVKFEQGDVHALKFDDNYFDRVSSTCLFHHLEDPLKALYELRRVTRTGGQIRIAMPTDPGIANQIVKRFVSYPRLRKITSFDPKLIYALEHRNHIAGLIQLIKTVFAEDSLQFEYYPLKVRSWNLNLAVVAGITVK
jgi:ubiquinone/menaquinone biosynthesis C-methylase UbiE